MVTVAAAAAALENDDDDLFTRPHSSAAVTAPRDDLQQYLQMSLPSSEMISIASIALPTLKALFVRTDIGPIGTCLLGTRWYTDPESHNAQRHRQTDR